MSRMLVLGALALCLGWSPGAQADMGLFSEGKQSFGLGLGGGGDQFVFSLSLIHI